MSSYEALNRLAKWRSWFAGWQLGTRPKDDPECAAVRDQRELLLIMRSELSALTALLVKKGVFTADEFDEALEKEAMQMDADLSVRFPGVTSTSVGLRMDPFLAGKTMKEMNFKP